MLKNSQLLKVIWSYHHPEDKITIEPNDGFDLGLMTTEHPVSFYCFIRPDELEKADKSLGDAKLCLDNKCPHGSVQIGYKIWKKIGEPIQVKIHTIGTKVLFERLK